MREFSEAEYFLDNIKILLLCKNKNIRTALHYCIHNRRNRNKIMHQFSPHITNLTYIIKEC